MINGNRIHQIGIFESLTKRSEYLCKYLFVVVVVINKLAKHLKNQYSLCYCGVLCVDW